MTRVRVAVVVFAVLAVFGLLELLREAFGFQDGTGETT